MSFFDSRKVGEILSRLRDTSKIRQAISGTNITVMIDTLLVIGGGIVLYIQSPTLLWVATTIIPFYLLIVLAFSKPLRKIHRKEMENSAKKDLSFNILELKIEQSKYNKDQLQGINDLDLKLLGSFG